MRRLFLFAAAVVVLMSAATTTVVVTTHRAPTPHCPYCHAPDAKTGAMFDTATIYECRSCSTAFYGPPRQDIAWADAFQEWLNDEPAVQ